MKLCKDCKWCHRGAYEKVFGLYAGARCTHPLAMEMPSVDRVTGIPKFDGYAYCSVNRMHTSDICGFEGDLWTTK